MLRLFRFIPLLMLVAFVAWCSNNSSKRQSQDMTLGPELLDLFATSGLMDGPPSHPSDLPRMAKRAGPDGMNRLFYESVDRASLPALKWMVTHGADPANIGVIERVPLLHRAMQRPQVDRLEYLLGLGLDPKRRSVDGQSLMHVGAAHGLDERVIALLKQQGLTVTDATPSGRQPIHVANMKSIAPLAAAGADLSAQDNQGRSALHWAALEGRADAVNELLRLGASVFVADKQGRTPLHLAAVRRSVDVIEALVSAGAPKAARDADGLTPRDLAESRSTSVREERGQRNALDLL
jgi:ankyrin repeat protein